MYLAELTRNLKQATAAHESQKKSATLCESNGWGNCCSGMGSGHGDYKKKLTSIPQPGLIRILAHMARIKMSKCKGKTKKTSANRTPELPLTNWNQKCIIQIYFGMSSFNCFCHLALGKQNGANHRLLKLFSWFDAKLRNVFYSPEVSSSLKHITAPVTWKPTYRHSINFC